MSANSWTIGRRLHNTQRLLLRAAVAAAVFLALLALWPSTPAMAQGCVNAATVLTTQDTTDPGSLRRAIADLCPGGIITFTPTLTASGPATITLTSGELTIAKTMTIHGPGANLLAISGNNTSRIFVVNPVTGTAQIDALTLRDGTGAPGGAIRNAGALTVTASIFTANQSSSDGGAIRSDGPLTVTASIFTANQSSSNGGGIASAANSTLLVSDCTFDGNTALTTNHAGGAIFGALSTSLDIRSSTFMNNQAYEAGAIRSSSSMYLSNSTLYNNRATSGGGSALAGGDPTILINTTIYSNSAPANGGAVLGTAGDGTFTFYNAVVAGNSGGNCSADPVMGFITASHSVSTDATCGGVFTQVPDALLGPPGDYGGAMLTVPLLPGSPAIDAGNNAVCAWVYVDNRDQRGVPRPQGKSCDIGAFESRGFTLAKGGGDNQMTLAGAPFAQPFTVTVASAFGEPVGGGQLRLVGPSTGPGVTPITTTLSITTTAPMTTSGRVSTTLVANSLTGPYQVVASVLSVTLPITYTTLANTFPTTVTAATFPATTVYGQGVTITATVASTGGLPTGSVRFFVDGSVLPYTRILDAAGVATTTLASLTTGTHPISATYSGSGYYMLGVAPVVTQTVNRAGSALTITSAPNPSDAQQAATFTVTVSAVAPGVGTPTGVVTITFDAITSFTRTLASGRATIDKADLSVGEHTVTAVYGGDGSFNGGSAPPSAQTVLCLDTIAVANTNDSGLGSLRRAVDDLCRDGVITFDPAVFGTAQTITLASNPLVVTRRLTIDGAGGGVITPTISGGGLLRVFEIGAPGRVAINRLAIRSGYDPQFGGGIYNHGVLTVTNSLLSDHRSDGSGSAIYNDAGVVVVQNTRIYNNAAAEDGGAIFNDRGQVTLLDSAVYSNTAAGTTNGGGGLLNHGDDVDPAGMTLIGAMVYSNTAQAGGGIYNDGGLLAVTNSTLADNRATTAGGGIANHGTLTVTNSTFAANSGADSGSLYNSSGFKATIANSTFAGGSIYNSAQATLSMSNSIAADSAGGADCYSDPAATLTSFNNLVEDGACSATLSGDPLLSALQNNGGGTWTQALLPGSPAIDHGSACTESDQRGVARPQVSACDIGAFESQGFILAKTGGDNQQALNQDPFSGPLALTVSSQSWQSQPEPVDGGRLLFTAPSSGASVTFAPTATQVIAAGAVTLPVTANAIGGTYGVTVTTAGAVESFGTTPAAVVSVTFSLTNTLRQVQVAVTGAPNPSLVGQAVTFTATVAEILPNALNVLHATVPTGEVDFVDETSITLTTASLVQGVVTFAKSDWAAGVHTVTAHYLGDATFATAASAPLGQVVQQPPFAVNDAAGTLEDSAVTISVLANDLDPAQGGLLVTSVTGPRFGTATIDPGSQSVTFTPAPGLAGIFTFTYVATDINARSDEALVSVVVTARSKTESPPQIARIDPAISTTVAFSSPGVSLVSLEMPAGAFTGTVAGKDIFYLAYTPVVTPTGDINQPPHGLKFGSYVFDLGAYLDGQSLSPITFAQPITLTFTYSPALVSAPDETRLYVYFWNGTAWSDDGITVLNRDPANHQVTIAITHLSEFAFFVTAPTGIVEMPEPDGNAWKVFLPAIGR